MIRTSRKDRDVIVVPCNGSFQTVFGKNIYICPSRRNHSETNFLAPYVQQKVERYAKIKYRIRNVKFSNPQAIDYTGVDTLSSRFEGQNINSEDTTKIREILNDRRIQEAIQTWYKSEKAWESDKKLKDGIQLYILEEWQTIDPPLRPINVSQKKFMGHRYSKSIERFLNSSSLDEACGFLDE
ncbi:MAG: hypothetical protein ACXVP2_09615 [Tumebacillaceae bacterium]